MRRPGPRAAALSGCTVLGVAGAVVLGVGLSGAEPLSAGGAAAAAVTAPPSGAPSQATALPRTTATAWTTPSSPVHVRVDAVGLDLPVLPLAAPTGVIDPPLLTAAYWVQPYGEPVGAAEDADNTLYLAAHSTSTGNSGFDPLLTADHQGSALVPGDVVSVSTPEGTVDYTVERTARYAADALAGATEVWEAVPGRLVLITCLTPLGSGATTEDLVVFATAR
ncbi:class F sortase [Modestobacter sp. VKM Ac-2986]|uniref:class F sortase n=1 Tax=Modestobacter sp. VKM Ac-2986 TaxID=3004140 RepID=UPI0022AA48CB|nr:class F sortase [Modestobacter sp. VKM Ac-2986]MCZ2828600.1 class F sortase [Modestobacter sp. VKM Ac-2986]